MVYHYRYKFSTEKLEQILNLATSGQPGTRIAEDEDTDLSYVYDRLRSAGIKLKGDHLPEEKVQEIYKLCKCLERPTVTDVSGLTGVCRPTTRKYMLKAGYVPKQGKPPISEERSVLILSLYLSNPECSNGEIAHAAGENTNTVYKHLRDNGYKSHCPQGFQPKKKTKGLEDKIK